jgi:catechol 2,3-dioxygenase-like lactoylglutathione lyase family enzyme
MEATWHHAAIAVEDIDRILKFYCDLLGFSVEWIKEDYSGEEFSKVVGLEDAHAKVVMLKGHGSRVELFHYQHPKGVVSNLKRMCDFGITHFTFSVVGIHEIYKTLSAEGVQFNCPPQNLRSGVWATYMQDPEGNTIELIEYLQ